MLVICNLRMLNTPRRTAIAFHRSAYHDQGRGLGGRHRCFARQRKRFIDLDVLGNTELRDTDTAWLQWKVMLLRARRWQNRA